ncbi:class I SAM-dependent methyltransferase [Hahella ganghwensis]|uniref:class I SAM-dependent methyltransferase n=1 Tax=Hahella ganghwensis TaxID=286420 RepID=UPI000372C1C9|nr:class I SAM-dependent methyltransferase [Hahella ganghwensis]
METSSYPCRVCLDKTTPIGTTDFNKSGNDHFEGNRLFPVSEDLVEYYRCQRCGYMFTPFFDQWEHHDFQQRIYNQDYLLADPPFAGERPERLAAYLTDLLGTDYRHISMLDYGGGEGLLEQYLNRQGISHCTTYDPYHHTNSLPPEGKFSLVTAFEVVEHVQDQYQLFRELCSLTENDGVLLFSTLLQPENIDRVGTDWWYVCPRNGHMAFHTQESLKWVLKEFSFCLQSLSDEIHIAWRNPNDIARRFINRAETVQVNTPSPTQLTADSVN